MSSWYFYSHGTRYSGDHFATLEELAKEEMERFEERLLCGKNLSKFLPVQGELKWTSAARPPMPAILPKNGISRKGLINEIWVPGDDCEIRIGDHSIIGVYQDVRISYSDTSFHFYRGSETDVLLLSYKKLKIVPYLWKD